MRSFPHHAPRHARARARRRPGLALVAIGAAGSALLVGPVHATALSAQPRTNPVGLGPVGVATSATSEVFGEILDAAHDRLKARRAVERRHERAVERARQIAHQERLERKRLAKVRASRSSLRSTVVRPVAGGYHLTARFGETSSRWGSGQHTGLDFACSTGTPVRVVADGVIISAGYDGAYGNRIEVRHADGTVTTYNHLSSILRSGGRVRAGAVVGRVGTTGNTTGAHLHFEVMVGGSYVDPERWLRARYVAF